MNGKKLIDSYQTDLPVQYTSNIELFAKSDTGVVIDSEPHLHRTCKTSILFVPLAACVHICLLKPLKQLNNNYKTVLFPKIESVHEISNDVLCATSKASDQPAHMRSLIRGFASRLSIL